MAIASPRPRLMLAVPMALAAVVLAAAGCGGENPGDTPTAAPNGGTQGFGSNPIPTVTPVATTTTRPPVAKPPSYPATPKAYAEAVLAAWKQGNADRLGKLTTPLVEEQIIEVPGPPNQNWSYRACEGAAGSSYCTFINADGDIATLRITNSELGKSHAATEVRIDLTEYPGNSVDYCKEFVEAWRDGNVSRMAKLALPEVVEYVRQGSAPDDPGYASISGGGGLEVIEITNTDGFHVELEVGTTLLGEPQAIRGYSP